MGHVLKSIHDVRAANDDFSGLARGAQSGDLIWDILASRIRFPAILRNRLERHQLTHHIQQGIQSGQVLLLEAPCGFGKTQAVLAAIDTEATSDVAWLTLEPRDDDPMRLLSLLAISLRQDSSFGRQSVGSGGYSDLVSLILQGYQRDRAAQRDGLPASLVLDDVHLLGHPITRALVEQLIAELPSTLALVLISNEQVSFATHTLSLDGRLKRLGVDELALSVSETDALFENEKNQGLMTSTALEHICHLTEGWLTPLQLYRLELSNVTQMAHSISDSPSVRRFFNDALLSPSEKRDHTALYHMAEPDLISDALYHAMTDDVSTTHSPSAFSASGLPLWPVTGKGHWYKFNPLFRDWLLTKGVAGRSQRALRASEWFESQGDRSEALTYALRAQNAERALEIAASGSEALLAGQDTGALLSWRRQLPLNLLERSPRLRLVYGWVHAIGGQFSQAEKLLEGIPGHDADALAGRLATLRAFILRGKGDVANSISWADRALADDTISDHTRLMSLMVRSSALTATLQFGEARTANRIATRLARESGDAGCEMLAVYDHARIELGKGYLKRAETLLRHGLEVAVNAPYQPPRVGESRLQLCLALVLWHQGRRDEAESWLKRSARQAEQCRDLGLLLNMGLRAMLAKSRGELEQAFSWIGQAERTMQLWQVDEPAYRPALEALKVSCWLHSDQMEHVDVALRNLKRNNRDEWVPELFPMLPGLLDAMAIRLCIARKELAEAQTKLTAFRNGDTIDGVEGGSAPLGHVIYAGILQALIYDRSGKPDKALVTLRIAMQEAAREHYLSPFIELGRELRTLLPKVLASGTESGFYDALRTLFSVEETPEHGHSAELAEPISDRERGVLELIATGLSNQDIADRLHISLHTVKTHARRINAKLNVRSRTQAIVRARELGVL